MEFAGFTTRPPPVEAQRGCSEVGLLQRSVYAWTQPEEEEEEKEEEEKEGFRLSFMSQVTDPAGIFPLSWTKECFAFLDCKVSVWVEKLGLRFYSD